MGIPGPSRVSVALELGLVGSEGGGGMGIPGPSKARVALELGLVGSEGGGGMGIPGASKGTMADNFGLDGGGGMGIPGPLANATLVEATKTAARKANWHLERFEVM